MSARHTLRVAILGAAITLVAGSAQARTIKLRSPSESLSLTCNLTNPPTNWSFTTGGWYELARSLLLDASHFGAGGTIADNFEFGPPFDTMDPKDLDGADVLLLNPISTPTDWIGLKVFGTYARGGVGFISFQNEGLTFFADKGGCAGENIANVTTAGAGTPVMNGPFGSLSSYFTGWNCSFDTVTMDPAAVLLSTNSVGPNAALLDLASKYAGAARSVSFGDEEHFGDKGISGCGAAGLTPGSPNETLLLNTFAYVSATAHDPIPDAQELIDGKDPNPDTDKDGRPDVIDGDNDGDGILDLDEAGDNDPSTPPLDTDKDGTPDYDDKDSDNDTIPDVLEGGSILNPPPDTDGDTVPDFRDTDSDGDNVPDSVEGSKDTDLDGKPDFRDTDSDDDTVLDGVDTCRTVKDPTNADTDGDGVGDACDNCPAAKNPGQEDADKNGVGDACESTSDSGVDAPADAQPGKDASSDQEAGVVPDASGTDGSAGSHNGGTASGDDGGCGCRVHSDRTATASWSWLVLAAAGAAVLRRRRAMPPCAAGAPGTGARPPAP